MFGIDKNDHQNRFEAAIAQLGERQTENLKVPGSIPVAAYASTLSSVVLEKAIHDRPRNSRKICLLYTSPSPRDGLLSRMPSSA